MDTDRVGASVIINKNNNTGAIMPIYDRTCDSCGETFEVHCKHSEKDLEWLCPYCGHTEGEWQLSAPRINMRSDRLMTSTNKPSGFKEVIQKIQSRNKRTEISKR